MRAAGDPDRILRTLALVVVVFVVTAISRAASADEAGEAKRLFEEARALLKDEKFPEACAKFAASFELDRKPGTQLNLGECAERDNKLRRAWLLFDDAAREYDKNRLAADARLAQDPTSADARRDSAIAAAGAKLARERADALVPRLATVIVRIAQPRVTGLAVRIGDHAAPPAGEIVEHLDAGALTITAHAPGREPFSTTAEAVAGGQIVVEIPTLRTIPDGTPGGGGSEQPVAVGSERRSRSRVRLAYGIGAGGLVVSAFSGIVALQARSQYNDAAAKCMHVGDELQCPTGPAADIDSAGTKADLATVLAIGGGVLVAGAIVVYLTAPREHLRFTPMASSSGAGVTLSGRF